MSRLSLLSLWGAGVVEGSLSQCLAPVSLGGRGGTGGYFAAVSLIDSWIH